MNSELNKPTLFAIIAVLVIGLGWLLWYYSLSPSQRPGYGRARFAKIEKYYKDRNMDIRKDPKLAPVYYYYHPEEKPQAEAAGSAPAGR